MPDVYERRDVTIVGRYARAARRARRSRAVQDRADGATSVWAGEVSTGAPTSPFGPALDAHTELSRRPLRSRQPTAGVLVFAMKTKPSAFSTDAPVRAVAFTDGSVGPLQTLTPALASEPVVQRLSGGRALALWATTSAIGAALTGPNGHFHATAAPSGPPPGGHINPTNRDLRTAGRYALFAWDSNGRVHVSMPRF